METIKQFLDTGRYDYLQQEKQITKLSQFCGRDVYYVEDRQIMFDQIHGNFAKVTIIQIDLTTYERWMVKYKGFFGFGKTLKDANKDARLNASREIPLEIRIKHFVDSHSLFEEYTGQELFDWHDYLTGSCKAGKYKFCRDNNVDFNKKYTVLYFLNLVKKSYKPEIIEQVIKQYEKL